MGPCGPLTRRAGASGALVRLSDGGTYEGEVSADGRRHGRGIYRWPDGSWYEGDFRDGRRHGQGVFVWPNGERYEGEYRNGEADGRGVYRWPDGDSYEGEFRGGARNGAGVYRWADGSTHECTWLEGEPHGQGVMVLANGRRLEGEWQRGRYVEDMQGRRRCPRAALSQEAIAKRLPRHCHGARHFGKGFPDSGIRQDRGRPGTCSGNFRPRAWS